MIVVADVITLDAGTYTWSSDYAGKTVKAADDAEVVLDMTVNGTPGLGGSDVTFEGITFDHAQLAHHSLNVQNNKSQSHENVMNDNDMNINEKINVNTPNNIPIIHSVKIAVLDDLPFTASELNNLDS